MINKILDLEKELSSLLPFTKIDKDRLDTKIRLEFNYNSNHIEGNTLTYGETQLLLMKGQASGDHEKRELDEMEAHDVAFSMIKEWAEDKERPLTETDIKTLNKIILVKPFYKEAITSDGQATRRLIDVGTYKNHPNSVRLANGEMHNYATPIDTPNLMKELMDWYWKEEGEGKMHAVELAALWHYRFVSIHPFDDGNGRIARLIMNYILLKADLPPVIIKSAEKKSYLQALNKADIGDLNAFTKYIAEQLENSFDLYIRAIKGELIEEEDDWMKELEVLSKKGKNFPAKRDLEITKQRILDSVFPLIEDIDIISKDKILPFFEDMQLNITSKDYNVMPQFNMKLMKYHTEEHININEPHYMHFTFMFLKHKMNENGTFNVGMTFKIEFLANSYSLSAAEIDDFEIRKSILDPFSKSDVAKAINAFGKKVTSEIKRNLALK